MSEEGRVFLFTGHMIDAPGRPVPRFPPGRIPLVARAIGDCLSTSQAGVADLALCGGACGGDILFAEAAIARGMRVEIRIPFEVETFLDRSVRFADPPGQAFGDRTWEQRFQDLLSRSDDRVQLMLLPRDGKDFATGDPYEANNTWQLAAARDSGRSPRGIVLWDGKAGDGPGGTADMITRMQEAGFDVEIIRIDLLA